MNKKKIALITFIVVAVIYVVGIVMFNNRIVPNTNLGQMNLSMVKFAELKTKVDEEFKNETFKICD